MIVAIDTNCIIPGKVGGIESYTTSLIESLLNHAHQVQRFVLLTRPENHGMFDTFRSERCDVALIPRPLFQGKEVNNWAAILAGYPAFGQELLWAYQQDKVRIIHETGADLVHFPGHAINPLDIDLP